MNTISPEETRLVELILAKDGHDTLSPDSAIEALQSSGLSPDVLATIWDLVDDGQKGFLSKDDLARAIRVIGWAQRGFPVEAQRTIQPGPLAYFEGYQRPAVNESAFLILPPLSKGHKAKYQVIFNSAGPEKELLSGYKVWETLVLSKLPLDTLTRIWDLVDATRRGSLTMAEFSIAMYLVHGILDGHFTSLPPAIPPHLREQAEEIAQPSSPVSNPISSAFTTDFYFIRASVDLDSWELPPILRKHADSYFGALDQDGKGYLEGEQTVTFLLDSSLPAEDLGHIWDIIDSTGKGHLTSDDFALALFLVYKALAGIKIPSQLPPIALSYRQETQPLCDVDKPLLNKRHSELPPLPPEVSLDLTRELEVLRAQLEAMTQSRLREKTTLKHEIYTLQCSQHELMTENSELRLSLRNTSQSMRRSLSMHTDKTAADNASLRKQLRHTEEQRAHLSSAMLDLTQENHLLQAKLESLATSLESKTADYDVQRLVMDETTAEMERLRAQVAEMRDATTLVPEAGGDEDLQRVINEDLAKENRRFRAQVGQLAEALREVQTAMVPRESLEEAKRVGRRLERKVREVQGRNEELQRQVEELGRRNAEERSENATAGGDVPPPAYQAIG